MKKAEEYFEETDFEDYIMGCLPPYRVKSLIKKVQEDTIRETLEMAEDMFEIQYDYDIEGYITDMKIDKLSVNNTLNTLLKEI